MLVKKSKEPTNYVLPVLVKVRTGVIRQNWYYENEAQLFKAYRQLLAIKSYVTPSYPVVYV